MFYILFSFVSFVCVILAAVCGYLYATIKAQRSSGTFAPVSVPDVPPVAIQTPEPIETPAPARVIIEPVKVAEPVSVPESPKPVKTPSPKSAPKAAEPKAAPRKTEGKKDTLPLPEGAPAKPVRSDYPDTAEGLASYKYDVHQYWNKVTALRRKMAKSGTATNAAPKAEPKAAPVPETKPEPKKAPKAPKAKPVTKPEPVKNEPKAEPEPVSEVENAVINLAEGMKKDDILDCIAKVFAQGLTELGKTIEVKIGKTTKAINHVSVTDGKVFFDVPSETDPQGHKEMSAAAVCFSKDICREVFMNLKTPKAEAPKPESKKTPKDVQPLTDAERYAQNTAAGIVTTLNNKNIQSVTFTDSIISVFTDPKTKKAVDVEITGLRRTDKGEVYVTFAMANNKVGRFELIKGAYVFNYETLRTIQKQVNEGAAKKRNANATIEYIKTVA